MGYMFGYGLFFAFCVGVLVGIIVGRLTYKSETDLEDAEENTEAEISKTELRVLKMSTHSMTECHAIDYAIECIDVRVRLEQFIKEKEL